jgi:hypothetical protein
MSVHRYPTSALLADYGRAGVGFALTGLPVLFLDPAPAFAWCLGVLAVIFAAFAARTVLRQITHYELSDEALVARGPWPGRIAWNELEAVKLRFFSTKRDRKEGWMQLDLKAAHGRIRVDSTLDDFPLIARRAVEAANARGVPLPDATRGNLTGLGIMAADASVNAPVEAR